MDAVFARPVTAGRNDTALAAADNQRALRELRIVADFDSGVERIAVEMGNIQCEQFAVNDETLPAAYRAATGPIDFGSVKAIAAECGHRNNTNGSRPV